MSDFMRVFEAKALAAALTEAGHSVSERTAQRWKKGQIHPKPQDVRAIRELIGAMVPDVTKEAAPEGAAEKLLELWTGADPPPWSNVQVERLIETVENLRGEAMVEAARQAIRAASSELRKQIRDERARGGGGSSRSTPGGRAKPQP